MKNLKDIDDVVRKINMISEQYMKEVDNAIVALLSSDEPLVWTNLGIMTEAQYNKLIEEGKIQKV